MGLAQFKMGEEGVAGLGGGGVIFFSLSQGQMEGGWQNGIKGGPSGGRTAWRSGARRVTLSRFDAHSCRLKFEGSDAMCVCVRER